MNQPKYLKQFFLITDIGFIIYWIVTLLNLIPAEYLFNDYKNELLVAWNWSFLPLDLFISASGLFSLCLFRRGDDRWRMFALLSLAFTISSGMQAIAFWFIRGDFDLFWWIPNLYLLLYPFCYIPSLLKS